MYQSITLPKTLTEMCEARDQAISQYKDARLLIQKSEETIEAMVHYGFPHEATPRCTIKDFVRNIDRRLWRQTYEKTGLLQYMDWTAKKEFEKSLEKSPPEFTAENCRSVLLSTAQDADNMFARGLVEMFLRLSKAHKTNTNESFRVPKKAVMTLIVEQQWNREDTLKIRIGTYTRTDELTDMDRVFTTLDGKQFRSGSLQNDINTQFQESGNTFENEYFRIKGYKNGNIHVKFLRDDLLKRANKIISDYYGGTALAGKR